MFPTSTMRHCRWLLAAGLALATPAGAVCQAPAAELDSVARVAVARRIHDLVNQYFVHWEGAPRAEVERDYQAYERAAAHAATRRDFSLATLRFIAALHNGHSQFFDSQMDGRPVRFRLLPVEGQWAVIGSLDAPLPAGTAGRTVNGSAVGHFAVRAAQDAT